VIILSVVWGTEIWSSQRARDIRAGAAWVTGWVAGVAGVWAAVAGLLVVTCSGVADAWPGVNRIGYATAAKLTLAPVLIAAAVVVIVMRRRDS